MKFVILLVLVAAASAAKLPGDEQHVQVVQDIRDGPVGAIYSNLIELDNGVRLEESGSEGSAGQSNAQGSFSFVAPDGSNIQVNYIADENGFQPESDSIPVDHPLPRHAEEQIIIAQQQKAEGIEFDERGFQI